MTHSREELAAKIKEAADHPLALLFGALGVASPTPSKTARAAREKAGLSNEEEKLAKWVAVLKRESQEVFGQSFWQALKTILQKEGKMEIGPGIVHYENIIGPLLWKLAKNLAKKGMWPMRLEYEDRGWQGGQWIVTNVPLVQRLEDIKKVFLEPGGCNIGTLAAIVTVATKSLFGREKIVEARGWFDGFTIYPSSQMVQMLAEVKDFKEIRITVYREKVMSLVKKFATELESKLQAKSSRPIKVTIIKEYA